MIARMLRDYRLALAGLVGLTALGLGGCSSCCGPYDYHYPAFPGIVQRSDPVYGRVGSIFSDPYKAGSGPSADSNLKPSVRKEDVQEDDLEDIPEALPDSEMEKPAEPPREPMNIDRETRTVRPLRNDSSTQWR